MYGLPLLHLLGLFCRWQCSGKRCIFGFVGFSLCLPLIMLAGSEYYHVGGRHRLDEYAMYAINWGSQPSSTSSWNRRMGEGWKNVLSLAKPKHTHWFAVSGKAGVRTWFTRITGCDWHRTYANNRHPKEGICLSNWIWFIIPCHADDSRYFISSKSRILTPLTAFRRRQDDDG